MVKATPILISVVLFLLQSANTIADTLYDIDDSTYEVDESNALVPLTREKHQAVAPAGHTHVELIDVKCDTQKGMLVTVEFEQVFSGIIYSQGYYQDPKCRFVKAGGKDKVYTFTVPYEGCGSKPSCSVCASVDNILVIQSDEAITETWDTARRITCSRGETAEKTIYFKPFVVDMLEVVNVPTSTGGVECWMDIQIGAYPKISPIPDRIKIGETLSVLVYLKDELNEYDLVVKDCYAYDNEDYNAKNTGRLQLSDSNGCSRKKKLFGGWQKTTSTGNSGATLVLHNTLYAFKFPDKAQVFLKCDIEICRNNCDAPVCGDSKLIEGPKKTKTTTAKPRALTTAATSPLSRAPATRGDVIRTRGPTRVTAVVNQRTDAPTKQPARTPRPTTRPPRPSVTVEDDSFTTPPVRARVTGRTRGPNVRASTEATEVFTRPQRVRGRPTTQPPTYLPPEGTTPFSCSAPENANDPRCVKPTTIKPKLIETTKFVCTPGSRDPRCPQPTTRPACARGSTDPNCPADCRANPRDPRCPQPTTQPPTTTPFVCPPGSTDPRCPPVCYPGSSDARCPQPETTTRFSCALNPNDPRCTTTARPVRTRPTETRPQRTRPPNTRPPTEERTTVPRGRGRPTTQAPTYLPPDQTTPQQPRRIETTPRPETTTVFTCGPRSTDPSCPPNCAVNPRDPRCPLTTTPRPTTTTTQFVCAPGSTDPRCPPNCAVNPRDPRCPQTTTPRPTPTTTRFVCTPGSTDPRCPKPFSTTPRPFVPKDLLTTPVGCYPGSPNPNCPQPYRPSSTNPPQTYLPPGPPQFIRQSRQIDPALIEDINNLAIPGSSDFHSIESELFDEQEQAVNENDLLIRKRRSYSGEKEIISITLNFKGYQFA